MLLEVSGDPLPRHLRGGSAGDDGPEIGGQDLLAAFGCFDDSLTLDASPAPEGVGGEEVGSLGVLAKADQVVPVRPASMKSV